MALLFAILVAFALSGADDALKRGDVAGARSVLGKLADLGLHEAEFRLGVLLLDHPEAKPVDFRCLLGGELDLSMLQPDRQAHLLLESAVSRGNAAAAYRLGIECSSGHYGRTRADCIKWFNLAADRGHVLSQYELARAHHRGRHTERNPTAAAAWCRRAAERGHVPAQYLLAAWLEFGINVDANQKESLKWYEAAAHEGYHRAETELAIRYRFGQGVRRSPVRAWAYYALASRQEEGGRSLQEAQEIAKRLSERQLKDANQFVHDVLVQRNSRHSSRR